MVNLVKNQKINLEKEFPGINNIKVGLGWDANTSLFGHNIDVDASVICIDNTNKVDTIVYYAKTRAYNGAIIHGGDNLTGEGEGDDEVIMIKLNELPNNIQTLSVIINIYSARQRRQSFSKVKNCFVRIIDLKDNKEIVHYDVSGNYDGKTGIFVADFHRTNGKWDFQAIGRGVVAEDIKTMSKIR